ncbi:MAG: hypothetical protein M3347_00390 [Armatimonadota bacterium]|nr:hypothetical protein [Armatimonadota bacterium]
MAAKVSTSIMEWRCAICAVSLDTWRMAPTGRICSICHRRVCFRCIAKGVSLRSKEVICRQCTARGDRSDMIDEEATPKNGEPE